MPGARQPPKMPPQQLRHQVLQIVPDGFGNVAPMPIGNAPKVHLDRNIGGRTRPEPVPTVRRSVARSIIASDTAYRRTARHPRKPSRVSTIATR
jgi:hypothetical protein